LYGAGFIYGSQHVRTAICREVELNDLNHYLLYLPEENPMQLDQYVIIEILDQAKSPERHEAMVNSNIDIFWDVLRGTSFLFQAFEELGEDQVHQQSKPCFTTSRKYKYINLLPVV
jgi:hypothetical protein